MKTPLFPDLPEMLSPRAAWIRKHKALTFRGNMDEGVWLWLAAFDTGQWEYQNVADFFFKETSHHGETRIGTGQTEDEALLDLCTFHDAPKHWSLP